VYFGDGPREQPPSFLLHVLGVMSLPHVEVILHFGSRALLDSTKEALANQLREAIVETFVPYA
jgi:hypothetical protein